MNAGSVAKEWDFFVNTLYTLNKLNGITEKEIPKHLNYTRIFIAIISFACKENFFSGISKKKR